MNAVLKLFVIFLLIYRTDGQAARCDYKYQYHWIESYKTTNASYYKCGLNTEQANYDEKLTRIYGQHLTGHTDADVKRIVNYKSNKLKTFSSIFCQKFPNLEVIQITNAEVESIDEDSLSNCKNLDQLLLFGNKIRELPENLLIQSSKLNYFLAWNNQLTTLPENLFQNQKELEDLELQNNQINFLPSNIFRPLVKLKVLQMFNNKLQSINPDWFVTLQNLKWMRLDGNKILEIPSECFASLGKLEKLFLYENGIKTLNSDSFDGLQELQLLSLDNNEISNLPAGVFTQLKNLQVLYLPGNKLTTIYSDSFGIHNQLTKIWLNDNKINAIYPNFLDNKNLSTFYTRNNICCKKDAKYISKFKSILKTCFKNYQPRPVVDKTCEIKAIALETITGGSQAKRGMYPWIAALIRPKNRYFCGGTLISNRKVVTAAHCMVILARDITVLLGVHDLSERHEVGRFPYAVQTINIHPDWNPNTEKYDADIAVMVLETEVTFGKFIQPICLMYSNSSLVTKMEGIVVGYGKDENASTLHTNIPKYIKLPIHNNEDCFLKDHQLARFSSKRTFCGGAGNGTGTCIGDSGSGLVVEDGRAYYLRGVVSASISKNIGDCDLNTYSILTNVLPFTEWINGISVDPIF